MLSASLNKTFPGTSTEFWLHIVIQCCFFCLLLLLFGVGISLFFRGGSVFCFDLRGLEEVMYCFYLFIYLL